MRIYGIDFTSAPRVSKPITCAVGTIAGQRLVIDRIETWPCFEPFETMLDSADCWIAGVDLPLGLPRRLIDALAWPRDWNACLKHVASMSKQEFVQTILDYSARQPPGEKHHLRRTDKLAKACSPMMMFGVPVGKMFYEGATRIAKSTASVLPCRPSENAGIVVECYPALLTRRLANQPYKGGQHDKDRARRAQRRQILKTLRSSWLEQEKGIKLYLKSGLAAKLTNDPKGDRLDAVACAIQVASAWHADRALGIPTDVDRLEGWIIDTPISEVILA